MTEVSALPVTRETKVHQLPVSFQMNENELMAVLKSSLYPGAKDESIKLVIGYCKAQGLDPMQKPVHIVPMSVKVGEDEKGKDKYEKRDVIMPGIGLYRTQAARTEQCAGISEPEFGETKTIVFKEQYYENDTKKYRDATLEYPEWCKVTVRRLMQNGQIAEFTAIEYWLENYATASKYTVAPNAMWRKRSRGQIAKCAEAQAWRKAFPEMIGAAPTAEEMEGKIIDETTTVIDGETGEVVSKPPIQQPRAKAESAKAEATEKPKAPENAGPITDGMKRVITAKLTAAALSEADLFKKFGVESWDGLKASQANSIMEWIKSPS